MMRIAQRRRTLAGRPVARQPVVHGPPPHLRHDADRVQRRVPPFLVDGVERQARGARHGQPPGRPAPGDPGLVAMGPLGVGAPLFERRRSLGESFMAVRHRTLPRPRGDRAADHRGPHRTGPGQRQHLVLGPLDRQGRPPGPDGTGAATPAGNAPLVSLPQPGQHVGAA